MPLGQNFKISSLKIFHFQPTSVSTYSRTDFYIYLLKNRLLYLPIPEVTSIIQSGVRTVFIMGHFVEKEDTMQC